MTEPLYIIPKNTRERFHVYKLTQKGVTIPIDKFGEFAKGVDAIMPHAIQQYNYGAAAMIRNNYGTVVNKSQLENLLGHQIGH